MRTILALQFSTNCTARLLPPPGLPPVAEGDGVNAQLLRNPGHGLPHGLTHSPPHISFNGLAVTTHWLCPQAPGCTDQRGDKLP